MWKHLLWGYLAAVILLPAPAAAQVGAGRDLTSFPHAESFDSTTYGDILQINPAITTYQHTTGGECFAGGCVKLLLQTFSGEDKSGLGSIRFPAGTTRLNIRWLQKYGTDFINLIHNEEWKLLILRRGSAERVMVLDWHYSTAGSTRTLRPCLNIDCAPTPNLGRSEFQINSYLGQWISIEMQVDTVSGQAHLFIDTPDGAFDSSGGATPFATKSITAGAVADIDILAGYWEGSNGSSSNHYLMIDELRFDTDYIGPPPGFHGAPADAGIQQDLGVAVRDRGTPLDLSDVLDRGGAPSDALSKDLSGGSDGAGTGRDTSTGAGAAGSSPLDGGCCDVGKSGEKIENLWLLMVGLLVLGLRRRRAR